MRVSQEKQNRLFAIASEHLHNQQDSEDAIQETFLRIADKPDKFFSLSRTEQRFLCIRHCKKCVD
ncbi:MAG: sigma factor [Oscillospiraceae bacterium]